MKALKKTAEVTSAKERMRMKRYRRNNKSKLKRKRKIRKQKQKAGVKKEHKKIGNPSAGYRFIPKGPSNEGVGTPASSAPGGGKFNPMAQSTTVRPLKRMQPKLGFDPRR